MAMRLEAPRQRGQQGSFIRGMLGAQPVDGMLLQRLRYALEAAPIDIPKRLSESQVAWWGALQCARLAQARHEERGHRLCARQSVPIRLEHHLLLIPEKAPLAPARLGLHRPVLGPIVHATNEWTTWVLAKEVQQLTGWCLDESSGGTEVAEPTAVQEGMLRVVVLEVSHALERGLLRAVLDLYPHGQGAHHLDTGVLQRLA
mmetsp:Transcript_63198/g.175254  ORF Transcript_63198/g.175254 Transcript_63198/m.175254 type:complete len:202 (-) Transcript_63198:338-943(-)